MKKHLFAAIALLSICWPSIPCLAQLKPTLVADINPGSHTSIRDLSVVTYENGNKELCFLNAYGGTVPELWYSGNATRKSGTAYSIFPSNGGLYSISGSDLMFSDGSSIGQVGIGSTWRAALDYGGVSVGGLFYFMHEGTLWAASHGGASIRKDVGATGRLCLWSNKLLFAGTNEQFGKELWLSDLTASGTAMVRDCWPGTTGGDPQNITLCGSKVYFSCLDAAGNREPWISDGTFAGTKKIKEINSAVNMGSDPRDFTSYGGMTYFTANNGVNGRELWVTDGTTTGTKMVKAPNKNYKSDPHDLVVRSYSTKSVNGIPSVSITNLYFFATDDSGQQKLFSSNGTAAGTTPLITFPTGTTASELTVCNGKLFYTLRTSTTSQLWCTDGTVEGTLKVAPSIATNINPLSGVLQRAVIGNVFYFIALFDGTGADLWKVVN